MVVVKRINNNALLCVDDEGHQVVALGCGLVQVNIGEKLNLNLVDHTFYDVDLRYIELIRDLELGYLEVGTQIANVARSMLTYKLSPNIEIALADHIQFAVQRMRERIYLSAPLTYDLQQNYPVEYKIAQWAIPLINKQLQTNLPNNEIAGIAMCIINSTYSTPETKSNDSTPTQEDIMEEIIRIVEDVMRCTIDREGFSFARFATHVQYLIRRVASGKAIESKNSEMYTIASKENPIATACAAAISAHLKRAYTNELTEEEKLYLILHINRICTRSEAEASRDKGAQR